MSEFDKTDDKKFEKVLVRKAKQLQDRPNRTLYANVGIVAILGGIIVFPLLIGILLGGWLDKNAPVDGLAWQLNLMLIGFGFGLYYAYRWVKLEGIEKIDEAYRKQQERLKK